MREKESQNKHYYDLGIVYRDFKRDFLVPREENV